MECTTIDRDPHHVFKEGWPQTPSRVDGVGGLEQRRLVRRRDQPDAARPEDEIEQAGRPSSAKLARAAQREIDRQQAQRLSQRRNSTSNSTPIQTTNKIEEGSGGAPRESLKVKRAISRVSEPEKAQAKAKARAAAQNAGDKTNRSSRSRQAATRATKTVPRPTSPRWPSPGRST